jgi:hypothetical protein
MANGLLIAGILWCSDHRCSLSAHRYMTGTMCIIVGALKCDQKNMQSAQREVLGPGRNQNLQHKRALGSLQSLTIIEIVTWKGNLRVKWPLGRCQSHTIIEMRNYQRRYLIRDAVGLFWIVFTDTLISSQPLSLLVSTWVSFECNGLWWC